MPHSELPQADLRRVADFCAAMWTEDQHDQVRGEFHIEGRSVTLCEFRAPWDGVGEWVHVPFAQLRYRPANSDWSLYWADHNSRWHANRDGNVATGAMARLLAEVDEDPTCVFKG